MRAVEKIRGLAWISTSVPEVDARRTAPFPSDSELCPFGF